MNNREPANILDEIASESMPQVENLWPGIEQRVTSRPSAQRLPPGRLALAGLIAAAVVLVAFFAWPGLAVALKNLVGFLPGVGRIDQSAPLRVLAHRATDQRGGFILSVENAILDSSRTIIFFKVEGQFPTWEDPALRPQMCREQPMLHLASGQVLTSLGAEDGLGGGVSDWKVIFPALPADENQAVLVIACLPYLPEGQGPQDWEIGLDFAPAPPGLVVYPVLESTPAQTLSTPAAGAPANQAFQLSIQGIAASNEGYYLQTVLTWTEEPDLLEIQIFPDALQVFDPAGQPIPAWLTDQIQVFAPASAQLIALDVQTGPIETAGTAILVLDYAAARLAASGSFSFDVGENPTPGQTWVIDQQLDISGYKLKVVSAEYIQAAPGEPAMLMVYLQSDSDIISITALDSQHPILDAGGSPGSENVPFRVGWHYKDAFPQGLIQVDITSISVRRSGPWKVEWTPPASETGAAAPLPTLPLPVVEAPEPQTACLNGAALSPAAPDLLGRLDGSGGLSGKIAFSVWDGEKFSANLANLDGSQQISLGRGYFPNLSPDGTRVVYMGEGGLYLYRLAEKTRSSLTQAEENIFYSWPQWSPDGAQIGFDRVTGQVSAAYVVDADGTNLRAVPVGAENTHFLGWGADAAELYYSIPTEDSLQIRKFNLKTQTTTDVQALPPDSTGIQLSHDGRRMIYRTEAGVFFKPDAASLPQPVILPGQSNPFLAVFSPDGRWMAISVWGTADAQNPGLVLIQPESCQMLWLNQPQGSLSDWIP